MQKSGKTSTPTPMKGIEGGYANSADGVCAHSMRPVTLAGRVPVPGRQVVQHRLDNLNSRILRNRIGLRGALAHLPYCFSPSPHATALQRGPNAPCTAEIYSSTAGNARVATPCCLLNRASFTILPPCTMHVRRAEGRGVQEVLVWALPRYPIRGITEYQLAHHASS